MHKNVFTTNVSKVENIYRKAVINEHNQLDLSHPDKFHKMCFWPRTSGFLSNQMLFHNAGMKLDLYIILRMVTF